MLRDGLARGRAALAEHRGQILRLRIDVLLRNGLASGTLEGVRVDDLLDGLALLVDEVVGRDEVTSLEDLLLRAVAREEMVRNTSLLVIHYPRVVSVLRLSLYEKNSPKLAHLHSLILLTWIISLDF